MITDEEIVQKFQSLLNGAGEFMNPQWEDHTQLFIGMPLWQTLENEHPAGCTRHMEVFTRFAVIPEHCFDCFKVEVQPRSVVELFKLLLVFEKLSLPKNNTRKCMVETRPDCSGTYKGFVYCRSIAEGKAICEIVRNAVTDEISPDVAVTLKRGCSEYAQAYPKYARIKPGTPLMEYRKYWKSKEDFVDQNVYFPASDNIPSHTAGAFPPWEIYSLQFWLRYAATIGDMSYLSILGRTLPPLPQLTRPLPGF